MHFGSRARLPLRDAADAPLEHGNNARPDGAEIEMAFVEVSIHTIICFYKLVFACIGVASCFRELAFCFRKFALAFSNRDFSMG